MMDMGFSQWGTCLPENILIITMNSENVTYRQNMIHVLG